jgi:hypothetical protein
MDCNVTKNMKSCTCTYEPCSRKGKCCECVQYHLRNDELPGCFFPPEVEQTFDRSRRRYIETFKKKNQP